MFIGAAATGRRRAKARAFLPQLAWKEPIRHVLVSLLPLLSNTSMAVVLFG